MTALAMDVLREVSEAGGTVRLEGEMLRLSAPEPLPDELRARLRQHKAEIVALLSAAEPANDVVHRVRLARASPACRGRSPTASTPSSRLTELRGYRHSAGHGCNAMLRGWSKAAGRGRSRFGWTAADLFGCDRRAPWHRLDRAGLVLLTGGHEIVELTEDVAALRTSTGSVLRYRRRPPARPPVALLWELLISAQATGPPIRGPTTHPSEERMAATYLAGPRRHPDHDHS